MARWGDEPDDSSTEGDIDPQVSSPTGEDSPSSVPSSVGKGGAVSIPPTHTSRVDSKGIKIVTSYRQHPTNPHQLLKTVTKIRVHRDVVRFSNDVSMYPDLRHRIQ